MGALDGKVAVVTGASAGSGLGIATRFVEEGASVVMLARNKERLEQVAEELGETAVPIATDVGDPDSVRAAFAEITRRFGKLDVLVNHAAVYRPCPVELLSDGDIERQIATNLMGPVYTSRAAIPLLRSAGGGDIVNTSSESTLHPFPMLSMYVASKAALEAFGVVLALEVREDDIRVTTVVQGTAQGGWYGVHRLGVGPRARRRRPQTLDGARPDEPGHRPLRGARGAGDRRRAPLHRDAAAHPEDGHGLLPQLLTIDMNDMNDMNDMHPAEGQT